MKCFYHKADLDGHCSGALVKMEYPECEMYPIDYHDSFPWELLKDQNEKIFMVDFSLKAYDMDQLNRSCQLVWLDHHSTAISANAHLTILGIKDTKKAACELTWDWFHPNTPLPKWVEYIGRYDVWDHQKNPDILAYQYGLRLWNLDPHVGGEAMINWQLIQNDVPPLYMSGIISMGRALLTYQRRQDTVMCSAYSFETKLGQYRVLALNQGLASSTVFDSKWDADKYDMMAAFVYTPKGNWKVTLYSTHPHIHCGEIAKQYGGGGHPGAAGFHVPDLKGVLF